MDAPYLHLCLPTDSWETVIIPRHTQTHTYEQKDNHEDKHKQKCSNPHKLSLIGRQSDGDNHYVASNLKHKKINPCYDVKEMFSLAMWLNVEYIESDGNLICD